MSSLRIQNISKVFRIGGYFLGTKITAVDDVSIELPSGKPWILSIVGESGSGKTTLAMMVLRLVEATSGEIFIDDIPTGNFNSSKKDFYKKVQPIFQNPFSSFSSKKKVDTYLYSTAMKCAGIPTKKEAREEISKVLESVGLSYECVAGKYPNQFSGGELQRISVARALITKPKLIVADEPVAMIDASLRMNIVNMFKVLKDEYNVNIIYITHDLSTAYYVSDYIATLYRGNLIEFGLSHEVLETPEHEYTKLLLESIPKVGQKWDDDMVMPDIEAKEYGLPGCKFASRCPCAKEICHTVCPTMIKLSEWHSVMCHRVNDYKENQYIDEAFNTKLKKI